MSETKNNENELIDKIYENVRMGSFAIDCIIEKIKNEELAKVLRKQNKYYLDMVLQIQNLSRKLNFELKDINFFEKSMSFVSIKMKTLMDNDSPKIAEMLIQGTTMGITDTLKAKTEFQTENEEILELVNNLTKHEEKFVDSLKTFL